MSSGLHFSFSHLHVFDGLYDDILWCSKNIKEPQRNKTNMEHKMISIQKVARILQIHAVLDMNYKDGEKPFDATWHFRACLNLVLLWHSATLSWELAGLWSHSGCHTLLFPHGHCSGWVASLKDHQIVKEHVPLKMIQPCHCILMRT